ncbi:camp-dependent protein kinase catalytic [Sesbania bispinosa]|nr:camp-dependent protein kinase catalytic [Sesbania bispinosa]
MGGDLKVDIHWQEAHEVTGDARLRIVTKGTKAGWAHEVGHSYKEPWPTMILVNLEALCV